MYQHYLPECYLKGFTEPHPAPRHEPAVWQFDIENPTKGWHRRSPANTGGASDFYRFTNRHGEADDGIEHFWGVIESGYPPALKRIETPGYSVSPDDRQVVAYFMAALLARVPAEIEKTKEATSQLYKAFYESKVASWISNRELFENDKRLLKRETGIDWGELDPKEIDLSQIDVTVPTAYAVGENIKLINTYATYLKAMTWLLIEAQGEAIFITSDRPVCSRNVEYKGELFGGGWASEDLLITFPLSRKTALCLGWDGGPIEGVQHGNIDRVELVNLMTVSGAKKLIVAPGPAFPGSADVNEALAAKFALASL